MCRLWTLHATRRTSSVPALGTSFPNRRVYLKSILPESPSPTTLPRFPAGFPSEGSCLLWPDTVEAGINVPPTTGVHRYVLPKRLCQGAQRSVDDLAGVAGRGGAGLGLLYLRVAQAREVKAFPFHTTFVPALGKLVKEKRRR